MKFEIVSQRVPQTVKELSAGDIFRFDTGIYLTLAPNYKDNMEDNLPVAILKAMDFEAKDAVVPMHGHFSCASDSDTKIEFLGRFKFTE